MDAVERITENTLRVPAENGPGLFFALKEWKNPKKLYRGIGELLWLEFNWVCQIDDEGNIYEINPIISRIPNPADWQLTLALIAPYAEVGGVLVYETVRGDLYRFLLTTNEVGPLVEWHRGRTVWEEF